MLPCMHPSSQGSSASSPETYRLEKTLLQRGKLLGARAPLNLNTASTSGCLNVNDATPSNASPPRHVPRKVRDILCLARNYVTCAMQSCIARCQHITLCGYHLWKQPLCTHAIGLGLATALCQGAGQHSQHLIRAGASDAGTASRHEHLRIPTPMSFRAMDH